jgi:hypothetical protein
MTGRGVRLSGRSAGKERSGRRHSGHCAGQGLIAVWSPGLDANGNSRLGRDALEILSKRMGWSIFGA